MPKQPKCPQSFSGPRTRTCKRSEECPWWIPNESEVGGDCAAVWIAISLSMIANEGLKVQKPGPGRPKAAKRRRRDRAEEPRP